MGKCLSKSQSPIPIQSYIDYVTDKSKLLWEKDPANPLNVNPIQSKPLHLPKKHKKKKKSLGNFFLICTYKEQKPESYDQNDVNYIKISKICL